MANTIWKSPQVELDPCCCNPGGVLSYSHMALVKNITTGISWGQNLQESLSLVTQGYTFSGHTKALAPSLRFLQYQLLEITTNTSKPGTSGAVSPSPDANINNNKL